MSIITPNLDLTHKAPLDRVLAVAETTSLDLRATPNGEIDVERLERSAEKVTVQTFTDWIRSRLGGNDPYLAFNGRDWMSPRALFVSIAQRSGRGSLLRSRIEESLVALLQEAKQTSPVWLDELLALVRTLRPETCRALLEDVVRCRSRFQDSDREAGLDCKWLSTAAAYVPNAFVSDWLDILRRHHDPKHVPIAYMALSGDPDLGLAYLPEFYEALRPEERSVLIHEALQDVFEKVHPMARFSELLRRYEQRYSEIPRLHVLVATFLNEVGLSSIISCQPSGPTAPTDPLVPTPRNGACYANIATKRAA